MNDTLPDELWKDSFDKLLEPQLELRGRNILKQNVRASFNMDSSVENSVISASTLKSPFPQTTNRNINLIGSKVISTPIGNRSKANPFQCSISPISSWKLLYFDKPLNNEKTTLNTRFEATKLNPAVVVVDYEDHNMGPSDESVLENTNTIATHVKKRQVCFQMTSEKGETFSQRNKAWCMNVKTPNLNDGSCKKIRSATNLALQPGKWRKSLSAWKRKHRPISGDFGRFSTAKESSVKIADQSVEYLGVLAFGGRRKSIFIKPERLSKELLTQLNEEHEIDYKKKLLEYCNQSEPLPFNVIYEFDKLQTCKKIGEGVFGEVFLKSSGKSTRKHDTVLKIIPIEGSLLINGELQKTFEQILPEIMISKELSGLRKSNIKDVVTSGFVAVEKITCAQGTYPTRLTQLWEDYDNEKASENDHPKVFDNNQLYIVFELAFGGQDLSSFLFNNAEQSYYAFQQIVLTIAAGEEAYQFEHRDLHWGNILLARTTSKHITYKVQGTMLTIPTKYVKVTIIDYTLSRINYNGCCLFNDLSADAELFQATGDYQFEIYRMMRELLCNKWDTYKPKTNIFWLSYILTKMIDGVGYKSTNTKTHSSFMDKLKHLQAKILEFESALQCAMHLFKI